MIDNFVRIKSKCTTATFLTGGEDGVRQYVYQGLLFIDEDVEDGGFHYRFMSEPFAGTSRVTGSSKSYATFEEALKGAEEGGVVQKDDIIAPITA